MDKEPKFPIEEWDSVEKYAEAGIIGYEPMTAKELDTDEKQEEALNNQNNYLEEKFDGVRALVYVLKEHNRVFSRRISKKTGFYVENSDSVPQIRDIVTPQLNGTILDGEMYIPEQGFQLSSAVMNCKYDKAISRQEELGFQVFHAFDIIMFKGKDVRELPLYQRKLYLRIVVAEINSPYISLVKYHNCGDYVDTRPYHKEHGDPVEVFSQMDKNTPYKNFFKYMSGNDFDDYCLPPREFYEYITATGGEGLIIKPKNAIYEHKRTWSYSKIKAFLTRELILVDFAEPTKEYKGKYPSPVTWDYWEDEVGNVYDLSIYSKLQRLRHFQTGLTLTPVSKYYAKKYVGNMILGIILTEDEYLSIPKNKRGPLYDPNNYSLSAESCEKSCIMAICECGGFDDTIRARITEDKENQLGRVVEVKANGLMKDSGRMRHPRFLRFRDDKAPDACIWKDHVGI